MIMSTLPNLPHVNDIVSLQTKGPWQSKSGGELSVLLSLTKDQATKFLNYDNPEFATVAEKSGTDIRGLRVYNVSAIPNGRIGANEFHLARTELVSALSGKALWRCEDVYGDVKEFTIDSATSLIVPYGILHTYTALEDDTRLQVICNTLFDPENPGTHDSYSAEDFRKLQAHSS